MPVGVALVVSGVACLLGGLAGEQWGPPISDYWWICGAGGASIAVGVSLGLIGVIGRRLGSLGGTLINPMPDGPDPSADVAQLMYEVAGNAFSAQAGLVQDMRGRAATLATVGPAAAGVIVATTSSSKLDVLATISLVLFAVAVSQSILALWRVRGVVPGPTLPDTLPAGTEAATLQLALAKETNAFRELNGSRIGGFEGLFWAAAASYLLAVLVWSVHAAANTGWLFVLH